MCKKDSLVAFRVATMYSIMQVAFQSLGGVTLEGKSLRDVHCTSRLEVSGCSLYS